MISNRPYLVRAFYQWIVDSDFTPILVIDINNPRAKVPRDYAEGGEIVFNISTSAIRDLKIGNDLIEFKASFSGVIHMISAPIKSVLAIYAEENGEGLFLDAEEDADGSDGLIQLKGIDGSLSDAIDVPPPKEAQAKRKPVLKLVE